MQYDDLSQKNELHGFIILYKTINVTIDIIMSKDQRKIYKSEINFIIRHPTMLSIVFIIFLHWIPYHIWKDFKLSGEES
jgi:uncharacterized membrane protein